MENRLSDKNNTANSIMFDSPLDWLSFQDHVKGEGRYVLPEKQNRFLETIGKLSLQYRKILGKDEEYWRARIGPDEKRRDVKNGKFQPLKPYAGKDIQVPPPEKRKTGRMNPVGIGYLYLASDRETAIAEVIPWKGALVSVVSFELLQDVEVIDLTVEIHVQSTVLLAIVKSIGHRVPDIDEISKSTWMEIISECGKPASPEYSELDYIPTQILTEKFKSCGVEGIIYKSAMTHTDGYNLVLFEEKLAQQGLDAKIARVKSVRYETEEYVDPYPNAVKFLEKQVKPGSATVSRQMVVKQ